MKIRDGYGYAILCVARYCTLVNIRIVLALSLLVHSSSSAQRNKPGFYLAMGLEESKLFYEEFLAKSYKFIIPKV